MAKMEAQVQATDTQTWLCNLLADAVSDSLILSVPVSSSLRKEITIVATPLVGLRIK